MLTKFIEATNGPRNWGKFAVMEWTEEEWWQRSAVEPSVSLMPSVGWSRDHYFVLDLQTGEGGIFKFGGYAKADLDKHRIWVCPLFEPFLTWLYKQKFTDLNELPAHVDLPDAEFQMSGYRRRGPGGLQKTTVTLEADVVMLFAALKNCGGSVESLANRILSLLLGGRMGLYEAMLGGYGITVSNLQQTGSGKQQE